MYFRANFETYAHAAGCVRTGKIWNFTRMYEHFFVCNTTQWMCSNQFTQISYLYCL